MLDAVALDGVVVIVPPTSSRASFEPASAEEFPGSSTGTSSDIELRARVYRKRALGFSAGRGRAFGRSLACEAFAFALEVRLVACDDLGLGGGVGGFVGAGEVDVDAFFDGWDA